MKLLFENTTKYTKDIYNTFLAFHRKKYRFPYVSYNVIIIALILFYLIIQVQHHNFTLAILFCFVLCAFILWRFLHPISEVEKEYKSEKIQKEQSFTFKFYDKFFTCENEEQISKTKYYTLHKVYETIDFFYLYIDRTHSFLLDKTKFKPNDLDSFSKFIKGKVWFKYKKDFNFNNDK